MPDRPDSVQRGRQSLAAGLFLCLLLCPGPARAAEEVQALRYGVTLYHFYQQDYFAALTELMAAQQLQQLEEHADTAELLRGGISLAYGMDRVAEQVFRELLSEASPGVDRDQAWFYLARMMWQQGQLERASAALAQMAPTYRGPFAIEADYLRASISLRRGDEPAAAGLLEGLPADSPWRYYLAYNLGAGLADRGEWLGALDYFRQLDPLRGGTPEGRALRDKALTAAGYAHLAAGQFGQAGEEFIRVALEGPMAERAMLGFGWARAEEGDYRAALSPWQALGERSLLDASVRESLLAIPYAYEQLGKHATALARYEAAAGQYAAELARVEVAIEEFRVARLQPLLGLGADEEGQEWLFGGNILPVGEHLPLLEHLLTRHPFQQAMRELRDLYSMAWHLADGRERLAVLAQADADQQRSWSTVLDSDRRELLRQRQQELQGEVDELRRRLDDALHSGDPRALVTAEQAARWDRLDRAAGLAAGLDTPQQQRELLQLYRGLLIWEDSENYPALAWQLRREMQALEALADTSASQLQRVDQAIGQRRQAVFAPRIIALGEQVAGAADRVRLAVAQAEARIRQVAVAELELQARGLNAALGQSRLAVARLYDLASPEVPR